jgi:hypothetical protein
MCNVCEQTSYSETLAAPRSARSRTPSPLGLDGAERKREIEERAALEVAQRLVITSFVRLSAHVCFSPELSFCTQNITADEYEIVRHPLQDPTGSLFLALLSVRRNRPGVHAFCADGTSTDLTQAYRRQLAARISLAAKFLNHSVELQDFAYIKVLLRTLLTEKEIPRYTCQWNEEVEHLQKLEFEQLLTERLHGLYIDNPLTWAERILFRKLINKEYSKIQMLAMRGSMFFLVGCCLLNPTCDVLEEMAVTMHGRDIGLAFVTTMEACLYARRTPPAEFKLFYSADVDRATLTVVENTLAPHAAILRAGPFMAEGPAHPVRSLLKPANLTRVKHLFEARVTRYQQ